MKWDEAWLRDHQTRMAATKPPAAASVATVNMIAFTLSKPTLLLNELRKLDAPIKRGNKILHGVRYATYRNELSAEIAALIPHDPYRIPFYRAAVLVRRFSVGIPDAEGAIGGCKPLLDVLQIRSGRHPTGLGILVNDSPEHLTLTVECEKVAARTEQRTMVTIERMARAEPIITLERCG